MTHAEDSDAAPRLVERFTVPAAESDRVFVDVAAYNSKSYFVQGDVAKPGKLPWTGHETVLDALNYAGGFIHTADAKNIKLVRPPRAGKPARVYAIDYEGIVERGEAEKNYQLFPGDRIVVGRKDLVKKTIAIDELVAPYRSMVYAMTQYATLARVLDQLRTTAPLADGNMPPEQRDEMIKAWLKAWSEAVQKPGEPLDPKILDDLLKQTPAPSQTPER